MSAVMCNNCKAFFETDSEVREHRMIARQQENEWAWSDPRYRVLMALMGTDHGQIMPDVSRRALGR